MVESASNPAEAAGAPAPREVYALDPRGVTPGDGRVVAWPVWAVQVRAPRPLSGDPFQRLVVRLLAAGRTHASQIVEDTGFPADLTRAILADLEQDDLVEVLPRGAHRLTKWGRELVSIGLTESTPRLAWAFLCALTGSTVPGLIDHPLPPERRFTGDAVELDARVGAPDVKSWSLPVRFGRLVRWLNRRGQSRLDIGRPLEPFDESDAEGTIGTWTSSGAGLENSFGEPGRSVSVAPVAAPVVKEERHMVKPTGSRQLLHLAVLFEPGRALSEITARCPFGLTDGRFYVARLEGAAPELAASLASAANEKLVASTLEQNLEAARRVADDRVSARLRGLFPLRSDIVEAERKVVLAETGAFKRREALAGFRPPLEAALISSLPAPDAPAPASLIASLPIQEGVRERFLKQRIAPWRELPDNLKATVKRLSKDLVRDQRWPTERSFTGVTLVAIAQLLVALSPDAMSSRLKRAVERHPLLLAETARLFAVLNPAAHARHRGRPSETPQDVLTDARERFYRITESLLLTEDECHVEG